GGVGGARIDGLGIADNFEIARVPAARICDFAERTLGGLPIDLAFVSCTNFPAYSALPALERRLRRPVVTMNQAAIASVLALLDGAPAGRGGGAVGAAPFRFECVASLEGGAPTLPR